MLAGDSNREAIATMDVLGRLHPQIVHTPVALLVFSAFFAIVGRLFDRDWVRKTSVLLLVFGFLGSYVAVRSGRIAHRVPEHEQGVSEEAIDDHSALGHWTMYVSGAALAACALATRVPPSAAGAVSTLALLLQLAAAVLVGVTGYRGGQLTFDYGANVRVNGVLVKNPGAKGAPHGNVVADSAEARGEPAERTPPGN